MSDLADSFEIFEREVLNIRRAWEYAAWISGNHHGAPDAVVLINAAPTFHWYISQGLLISVVLGLSRLADPKTDHLGNKNLTLKRIYDSTDFSKCSDCDNKVGDAMKEALIVIQSDGFKNARNKALAHNDLQTVLAKNPLVEMDVIKCAVQCIARFHCRIKAVREGTSNSSTTSESVEPSYDDVQICEDEIVNLIVRLQRSM